MNNGINNKYLVVLSGGMDSTTALASIKNQDWTERVEAVTFDYGSKHNEREGLAAREICAHYDVPHTEVALPFINELFKSDLLKSGGKVPEGHYADPSMKRTVVPFRNGIMLSIAVGLAESKGLGNVVIGNHFGDHAVYPDCRPNFISAFTRAAKTGTYEKIKIYSPFMDVDKTAIATLGDRLKVPFVLTWSCYNGVDPHCGKCGTCYERIEAFRDAGVKDPTEYAEEGK